MKERSLLPEPEFESYYGRPILKAPTWKTPHVPFYLFLGGMAGGSAILAEGAAVTGRPNLARVARLAAGVGAAGGTAALIHDLGRPERFLNMLRVLKPTSPLSVGSFILAPFGALSAAAVGSQLTGWFPRTGRLAGVGAAALGPLLATYTSALLADTAIPAWHEAHRELPFVFGGSAAAAAGGVAMTLAPAAESGPAVRMAAAGAVVELAANAAVERRSDLAGEPYRTGFPGRLMKVAGAITLSGLALTVLGRRRPWIRRIAGAAFAAGSLTTRFGVYEAGKLSANDPKYTVVPQRERLRAREAECAQ
jgi:formate-dependent nitrite reductase membrane component NrfD